MRQHRRTGRQGRFERVFARFDFPWKFLAMKKPHIWCVFTVAHTLPWGFWLKAGEYREIPQMEAKIPQNEPRKTIDRIFRWSFEAVFLDYWGVCFWNISGKFFDKKRQTRAKETELARRDG